MKYIKVLSTKQPDVLIYITLRGTVTSSSLHSNCPNSTDSPWSHVVPPPSPCSGGTLPLPREPPPPQYSQFALGKRRLLYKSTKSIILLNSNLKDTGYQIMAFVNILKCAMWKRKLLRRDICPTVFKLGTIVREIWHHRSN